MDVSRFRVCLVPHDAYPELRVNHENPFSSLPSEERLRVLVEGLAHTAAEAIRVESGMTEKGRG